MTPLPPPQITTAPMSASRFTDASGAGPLGLAAVTRPADRDLVHQCRSPFPHSLAVFRRIATMLVPISPTSSTPPAITECSRQVQEVAALYATEPS
jgi:hypothetical protein